MCLLKNVKNKTIIIVVGILVLITALIFASPLKKYFSGAKSEATALKAEIPATGVDYSSQNEAMREKMYVLISSKEYEKAYSAITQYFKDTPKEAYLDDFELWADMSLAAGMTNRCMEATTSAWHAINNAGTDGDREFAESLMSAALNIENCIDT